MIKQFLKFTSGAALSLLILSPYYTAVAADDKGQTIVKPDSSPAPVVGAPADTATTLFNRNLQYGGGFVTPDKVYTAEEIRNAKPLPWLPAKSVNNFQENGLPERAPASTDLPQEGPSSKPNAAADEDAQLNFSDQWQIIQAVAQMEQQGLLPAEPNSSTPGENSSQDFAGGNTDFGTRDIYTAYPGNYWSSTWTTFPHRAIGKLLLDNGSYCTAQVISPKNIIVTAAHCVYKSGLLGGWLGGWTFVPAERYGAAPYGQFRWTRADIIPAWIPFGSRRFDVALIQLANNSSNRPVTYYTGYLGWRTDYPYVRNLHSFGYADNISAQYTSVCTAESFYAACEGTDVLVKGCNMTYGSSGGAWIDGYRPFQSGASNFVESVVSGDSCAGAFGQTYVGLRFTSANFGTLCARYSGC